MPLFTSANYSQPFSAVLGRIFVNNLKKMNKATTNISTFSIFICIFHILGALILVGYFNLGVIGTALSTVLAEMISVLLSLFIIIINYFIINYLFLLIKITYLLRPDSFGVRPAGAGRTIKY